MTKVSHLYKYETLHHLSMVCVCVIQRPDEEVVVDQGGTSSVLNIHYEKEELEGEYVFFNLLSTNTNTVHKSQRGVVMV